MRILIVATGWNSRGALAASRALAAAGWEVGGATAEATGLIAMSRSVSHVHAVPSPEAGLDAFTEAIAAAVTSRGYEAVLPSRDPETFALSATRDRIPACVPYPPHELVLGGFDKLELAQRASRCGIATPWTSQATEEALAAVDGPVVVKVRFHWTPGATGMPGRWRTYICPNREEAARRVDKMRAAGGEPLLQEVVRGPLVHCHVLMDREGNLVTAVQQRSEPLTDMPLTWPPGAGIRVRSVTVPLDDELAGKITTFLRGLSWQGFVGLMFILGKDGEPRLVDFNGRIPMSFHQSIAACPELPNLWARVATGRELPDPPAVRVGVRYQWFWGDVRRALNERRGGLVADLLGCLAYARGSAHGIWSRDDPWPAIRYCQRHFRNMPHTLKRKLTQEAP